MENDCTRIIFIRHGHPDYSTDSLTELGHRQAEAAALRVREEGIRQVFSSTMGRAVQTARHIAAPLGLEVTQLEFMREIRWGSLGETPIPHNGHPWHTVDDMVQRDLSLVSPQWETEESFRENKVVASVQQKGEDFDLWLREFGLEREGEHYRMVSPKNTTVALVSHAGASDAVLSHLLNLPFPMVCKCLSPNFTAVTVVSFKGQEGALISPQVEILNDARHIRDISEEVFFGN